MWDEKEAAEEPMTVSAAKRGEAIIWCDRCEGYMRIGGTFDGTCPVCGESVNRFRCTRCDHRWKPRKGSKELPRVCPKCKSGYWNRMRTRDDMKDRAEWIVPLNGDKEDLEC